MKFGDLRDFLRKLEACGELKRIHQAVDPALEITEICYRTLKGGGPALLFTHPEGASMPLLGNLFGSSERVALGLGHELGYATARGRRTAGLVQGA